MNFCLFYRASVKYLIIYRGREVAIVPLVIQYISSVWKIAFLTSTIILPCEYIKSRHDEKWTFIFLTNSRLKFSNVNSKNNGFNIWVYLCGEMLLTKTYL